MAAKTKFILEAEEAKAVRAFLKVVDAQKKATQGTKNLTRESAKTQKGFSEIGGSLKGMVGMLGLGGGIAGGLALVRSQTQKWGEEVSRVSAKFFEVNKEIIKAVSQAGDLAHFAEIQEKLKLLPMPGIGPTGRLEIYRGFREALPLENLKTILNLMPEAGRAKLLEEPSEFAGQMGVTHKLYGGKLAAGDVADVSKAVTDMLGGNAAKFGKQVFKESMQLVKSEMKPDEALALAIAAANAGQLRGISTLAGKLTQEKLFEPAVIGGKRRRISEREQTEQEFYAIQDPAERLRWLIANRGRGGKAAAVLEQQGILNAIAEADIAGISGKIAEARETDYFRQAARRAERTKVGGPLMRKAKVEALEETESIAAGERVTDVEIARALFRTAETRARSYGVLPLVPSLYRTELETSMAFGMQPERALRRSAFANRWLAELEMAKGFPQKQGPNYPGEAGQGIFNSWSMLGEAINDLIGAIREQTESTKKNTDSIKDDAQNRPVMNMDLNAGLED